MAKRVAILGSGVVGEALAAGFLKYGFEVMRASRDGGKLGDWKSKAGARSRGIGKRI
jgi:predicted dinucleotide-binding enzyme